VAEYVLEVTNLSKEFPGVQALDRVTLRVKSGEIHAIVGENGAGKSTLMKVLSGVYPHGTYGGQIMIRGEVKRFRNVRDAEAAGIAIIYQELLLVKHLSIAENIHLGALHADRGVINWDEINFRALEWIRYVGLDESPVKPVRELGVGKQQLVEIAKALSKNAHILILDEPTAALTDHEVEHLERILRDLKGKGVTCLYISHKLSEVLRISDTVTIMRDGRVVATEPTSTLSERSIVAMMVGRDFANRFPPRPTRPAGDRLLEVDRLTLRNPELPGRYLFKDISFSLHAGEIVGVAGLMGAGRTELVNAIFGVHDGPLEGEIRVRGRPARIRNPESAIEYGIGLLTEDRKLNGLNLVGSVSSNMVMASLGQFARHGVIDQYQSIVQCEKYVDNLKIKTPGLETLVWQLSGGNQQKVVLAKWLMVNPSILLIDEPTRGIDVGAKYEIYNLMIELTKRGIAILMVSSELPEIIGMSDRILVMREGRLAGEFASGSATEEIVMQAATGSELR
jgi:D-xylose transport system ATP-binding protein